MLTAFFSIPCLPSALPSMEFAFFTAVIFSLHDPSQSQNPFPDQSSQDQTPLRYMQNYGVFSFCFVSLHLFMATFLHCSVACSPSMERSLLEQFSFTSEFFKHSWGYTCDLHFNSSILQAPIQTWTAVHYQVCSGETEANNWLSSLQSSCSPSAILLLICHPIAP